MMATTEEKKVLQVYGMLAAALLLMLIPHVTACAVALLLLTGALAAAYAARKKAAENSLVADHMNFIIRTVWLGTFMAMLTTTVASVYMLQIADLSPLQPCANQLADMMLGNSNPENAPDYMKMTAVVTPCVPPFVDTNRMVFINALMIAALLPMAYFAWRMAKGLNRALRGHRMGDGHKWF
jgi:uncharacterized membrane protein